MYAYWIEYVCQAPDVSPKFRISKKVRAQSKAEVIFFPVHDLTGIDFNSHNRIISTNFANPGVFGELWLMVTDS